MTRQRQIAWTLAKGWDAYRWRIEFRELSRRCDEALRAIAAQRLQGTTAHELAQ